MNSMACRACYQKRIARAPGMYARTQLLRVRLHVRVERMAAWCPGARAVLIDARHVR